jgi:regulation of enolase protein 1 (concanavalin A-like superfamily)
METDDAPALQELDWDDLTWRHPPARAERDGDGLLVTTGREADWWRLTGYGFIHADGHLLAAPLPREGAIEVTFTADLTHRYDQAGLMLHADDETWIKAGLERDGPLFGAVVVTRGFSDWSVAEVPEPSPGTPVTVRASRRGDAVTISLGFGHAPALRLLRLAYLPPELDLVAGPMACSPTREGLVVRFDRVRVGPPDPPLG